MDENKNTNAVNTALENGQSEKKVKRSRGGGGTAAGDNTICEAMNFAAREAFKRLRTNIVMRMKDDSELGHVIGITSAQPSEGKSTISVNLSYSLAELGKRVLLVDGDMRRSSIHIKLNKKKAPGLSDLMTDLDDISSTIQTYSNSKGTTSFDIISGGTTPSNPSEILESKRMVTFLQTLKTAYDYIILDLPPVGAVTDAVSVSKHIDGMIVAIRENHCPRGVFTDCVSQLQEANVNILGFVLNGALEGAGKKYQYGSGKSGSGYGYGYGYGYY